MLRCGIMHDVMQSMENDLHNSDLHPGDRFGESGDDHLDKDGGGVHGGEEKLTQLNLKL